jgi:hypothetical protein
MARSRRRMIRVSMLASQLCHSVVRGPSPPPRGQARGRWRMGARADLCSL